MPTAKSHFGGEGAPNASNLCFLATWDGSVMTANYIPEGEATLVDDFSDNFGLVSLCL